MYAYIYIYIYIYIHARAHSYTQGVERLKSEGPQRMRDYVVGRLKKLFEDTFSRELEKKGAKSPKVICVDMMYVCKYVYFILCVCACMHTCT